MFPEIRHPPASRRLIIAESLMKQGLSAALAREFTGISRLDAMSLMSELALEADKPTYVRAATNDPSLLSLAHSMYALQSMKKEFERQPDASTIECIVAAFNANESRVVETYHDKYYRATLARFIKIYKTVRENPASAGKCENCGCSFLHKRGQHDAHCPLCRATRVKICAECHTPYVQFSLQPYRGEGIRPNRCGQCITT